MFILYVDCLCLVVVMLYIPCYVVVVVPVRYVVVFTNDVCYVTYVDAFLPR
jgi:hypothetical protein